MNHVLTNGRVELLPDEAELHLREDEAGLRLALGLEPVLHFGPIAEDLPRAGHVVWWGRFARKDRVELGVYCGAEARLRMRIVDEEGALLAESQAAKAATLVAAVPHTGIILFQLTNLGSSDEALRLRVARHRGLPSLVERAIESAPARETPEESARLLPGLQRRGRA